MIKKAVMREIGRAVLEKCGYETHVITSQGVLHGARLEAKKDGETFEVGIRSAQQRAVGFTRKPDGEWRGLSVDLVVVVVPVDKGSKYVEVLMFKAKNLKTQFNAAAKALSDKLSTFETQVLIPLDRVPQKKLGIVASNLKEKALWSEVVDPSTQELAVPGAETFFERVKREFAEQNQIDVSKVVVEFRIIA